MSQQKDEIVQSLSDEIEKLLAEYGVTYQEFSCVNFGDVNCDVRLWIDKRDSYIFLYGGLGRLQHDVEESGIRAEAVSWFHAMMRQAYEMYELTVNENTRTAKNSLMWEHMRVKAKADLEYQQPIFRQLKKVWEQLR